MCMSGGQTRHPDVQPDVWPSYGHAAADMLTTQSSVKSIAVVIIYDMIIPCDNGSGEGIFNVYLISEIL